MTKSSSLLIGLDCSTSACKAIVCDKHGNTIAQGKSPLELISPKPTLYEQSADSWWLATLDAIRQVVDQVDGKQIAGLSIAHQRETFVPVDESGLPLSHGILWMDERSQKLLPELDESFSQLNFHQRTGKRLSVNLTIGKIAWLKAHRPDIFSRTFKYLDVHAYIVHKLTGHYRTGWGCADPTGMFNLSDHNWDETLLQMVGIEVEQLPVVFPPGSVIGEVTEAAAEVCNLPVGIPVAAGIGDGQASGLGVNITSPGDAYLSLGTSVISGTFSEDYIVDPAFRTMTGGIPTSYLLETVLLGGGFTLSWFFEKIVNQGGQDIVQIREFYNQAARDIPPGSSGLVVIPYWNSVLGPYWDPLASGVVVGWRGNHGLPHLYRAILEGIAFEQRLNTVDVENALGQPIRRYIVIGGGAQSELWCQIIADISNKPVYRAATSEAAALGACILAATAVGEYVDIRQAASAMTKILPDPFVPEPLRHKYYNRIFEEVYRPLFPALQHHLRRLTTLSNYEYHF